MITNNLQKIRVKQNKNASTLAKKFGLSLQELHDIENNKDDNSLYANKELISIICKYLKIEEKDLFTITTEVDKVSKTFYGNNKKDPKVIFLDTSTIMNYRSFAQKFLKYFSEICLTKKVYDEINMLKESGHGVKADKAQSAFREISRYKKYITIDFEGKGETNDAQILDAAYNYAKNNSKKDVYFVSDDKFHTSIKVELKNLTIYKGKEFENLVGGIDKAYSKEETKMFWKYLENKSSASVLRLDLENVDINYKNDDEMTPLCYTMINGLWDVAWLLVKRPNIDLNEIGCPPDGFGALHYAVNMNNIDFIKELYDQGAYMNLLTKHAHINNVTPLMLAAKKGNVEIMEFLMSCLEVTINQQDSEGRTALHYAAIANKGNAYIYLLEQEADDNLIDSSYDRADEIIKRQQKSS